MDNNVGIASALIVNFSKIGAEIEMDEDRKKRIKNAQLNEQVRSVLEGKANTQMKIDSLEEKIERLQKASSDLDSSLSEVESLKDTVTKLEIDQGKWKGEEYQEFEDAYDSHKEKVKKYVTKTEEAKEDIDDDIERYQEKLDTAVIGLENLDNLLEDLQKQIDEL